MVFCKNTNYHIVREADKNEKFGGQDRPTAQVSLHDFVFHRSSFDR